MIVWIARGNDGGLYGFPGDYSISKGMHAGDSGIRAVWQCFVGGRRDMHRGTAHDD